MSVIIYKRWYVCDHIWTIICEVSYMVNHIWSIIYDWSYMIDHIQLLIYGRSHMVHHIWKLWSSYMNIRFIIYEYYIHMSCSYMNLMLIYGCPYMIIPPGVHDIWVIIYDWTYMDVHIWTQKSSYTDLPYMKIIYG